MMLESPIYTGWEKVSPRLGYANFYEGEPGSFFGPRSLRDFQLIFVLAGEGEAKLGDAVYDICSGDILFSSPRVVQFVRAVGDQSLRLVGLHFVFDESEYGGAEGISCLEKTVPVCSINPLPPPYLRSQLSRPIFTFCKDLALSYISSPNGRVLEKKGLLLLLFQAWQEEIEKAKGGANISRRHLLLVERAESALCKDLKESPSWSEIAAELQVSKRYLSDLFRLHTGIGFKGYLKEQRLVEGRRLLTEGTMTISEVAYAVGFNDPFYFSQEFSKRFKLSPSAFRQQFRTI